MWHSWHYLALLDAQSRRTLPIAQNRPFAWSHHLAKAVSSRDTNAARIFQTDDGWYVDTREGNVGPLPHRRLAVVKLNRYIKDLKKAGGILGK